MSQPVEHWTLRYHPDVTSYLYDLREAGGELRKAVKSLAKGIPTDARKIQDAPETWEWLEARHWVTFVVDPDRQWIYITGIESATVE